MIVFNLGCENSHRFEGWFASTEDYAAQREKGLVGCPSCGAHEVERVPSATRFNAGVPAPVPAAPAKGQRQDPQAVAQKLYSKLLDEILARYPRVQDAIVEACHRTEVVYVAGNHDPPIADVARAAPWRVCRSLLVDEDLLVLHGHELDAGLTGTAVGRAGELFGQTTRAIGEPFGLPLSQFDTLPNRALAAAAVRTAKMLDDRVEDPGVRAWVDDNMRYLVSLEAGNLYRYIRGLEENDLVADAPAPSSGDGDERRIYYRLTPLGKRVLAAELERLRSLVEYAEDQGIIARSRA